MRRCATTLEAEMRPEEHALLLETVRAIPAAGRCLEIGTAAGGTLARMMQCRPPHDGTSFVVVDPMRYFPDQLETVRRNLRAHGVDPARVEFRAQTSAAAFRVAAACGESFRFMVIDGSHKIMGVTADLRWLRLLEPGGVACFHDFCPGHPGVYLPISRFIARYPKYERRSLAGSLLVLRKTAASAWPEIDLADWAYAGLKYLPLQIQRKLAKLRGVRDTLTE